jgi:hypothetical protein
VWALIRSLPDELARAVADWSDRTVMSHHGPEDIDGEAVCLRCQTPWPCDEFMHAERRRDARRRDTLLG